MNWLCINYQDATLQTSQEVSCIESIAISLLLIDSSAWSLKITKQNFKPQYNRTLVSLWTLVFAFLRSKFERMIIPCGPKSAEKMEASYLLTAREIGDHPARGIRRFRRHVDSSNKDNLLESSWDSCVETKRYHPQMKDSLLKVSTVRKTILHNVRRLFDSTTSQSIGRLFTTVLEQV